MSWILISGIGYVRYYTEIIPAHQWDYYSVPIANGMQCGKTRFSVWMEWKQVIKQVAKSFWLLKTWTKVQNSNRKWYWKKL